MTRWQYILRRLGAGFLVWLSVLFAIFFLFQLLPGDPARLILGQRADPETIALLRKELGLDQPVFIQFLLYLNDLSPISIHENTEENRKKYNYLPLVRFDEWVLVVKVPYLRRSYHFRQPVSKLLLEALPNTVALAVSAMVIALAVALFLGSLSAITYGSWVDSLIVAFSTIGISVPSFFSGLVVAWLFGYVLADWTGLPMGGSLFEYEPGYGLTVHLENLVLPALTLGLRPAAILTQMTRSSMLDIMYEHFVLTGYAKGLSRGRVFFKYILRNALNPVVTVATGWFAALLTGAFFIEYIFSWKGVGLLAVQSLKTLDLPVIMGVALLASTIFVLINIAVDIIYGLLDPRVSYR